MMKRSLAVCLIVVLLLSLCIGGLSGCAPSDDALYRGSRKYNPEWAVVPPRLIGEHVGTTEKDIAFDPYGVVAYNKDKDTASQIKNPFNAVIPAGTAYYAIKGYDSNTYLALPNGGNYYLYSSLPKEKPSFPQGKVDTSLADQLAGTPAQLYLEAFMFALDWDSGFVVLNIVDVDKSYIDNTVALIAQYCDQKGITLFVTTSELINSISLSNCTITGNKATIQTGVMVAPLFGYGTELHLEKENSKWVITEFIPTWIS